MNYVTKTRLDRPVRSTIESDNAKIRALETVVSAILMTMPEKKRNVVDAIIEEAMTELNPDRSNIDRYTYEELTDYVAYYAAQLRK